MENVQTKFNPFCNRYFSIIKNSMSNNRERMVTFMIGISLDTRLSEAYFLILVGEYNLQN